MSLRTILDSSEDAKAAAEDQTKKREAERSHIREKLSETDRAFLDKARELFPSMKLVGIRFSDGEQIGRSI